MRPPALATVRTPTGGIRMSDPWHPEGIYQCNGCFRTYPEYVNGCVEDHPAPRKVRLVVPETAASRPPVDEEGPAER